MDERQMSCWSRTRQTSQGRQSLLLHHRRDGGAYLIEKAVIEDTDDLLLGVEVVVEQPLGHPDPPHDIVHRGVLEPLLVEEVAGRLDDLVRAVW